MIVVYSYEIAFRFGDVQTGGRHLGTGVLWTLQLSIKMNRPSLEHKLTLVSGRDMGGAHDGSQKIREVSSDFRRGQPPIDDMRFVEILTLIVVEDWLITNLLFNVSTED